MKKLPVLLLLAGLCQFSTEAQVEARDRVITTAVPFLNITADARAAGMGDVGVATSADAFSQQWNPAKYAFAERKMGIALSYTPYLSSVVSDIGLLQANYFNKLDEQSSFAIGLRYFTLGEIELRQTFDGDVTIANPNELALDGSYSLKLSPTFSMAVAGRYIRSNLQFPNQNNVDSDPGSTFAVDVAGFYRSQEIAYNNFDGRWRAGFNISNLGGKNSIRPKWSG